MIRAWKRLVLASVLSSGALVGRVADADDSQVLSSRQHDLDSPQNFAFEFRGGLYSPRIDSDPALGGKTPYANTFGTGSSLELALEMDWQALRIPYVGTIGPGLGFGYTTSTGATQFISGKYTGQTSGETTALDIYPMYLVVVLRADALLKSVHMPLVPYVKGGVGYALWVASQGGNVSVSAAPNFISGRGHTFGTQFAVGLSFALDVFDPHASRELDNSMGINHTYLFAEYMLTDLTGLGQEHALLVGSHSPVFGLTLEF